MQDEVEESKAASKLLYILLDAGVDPNVRNVSGEVRHAHKHKHVQREDWSNNMLGL
jgi:hypothetical protein